MRPAPWGDPPFGWVSLLSNNAETLIPPIKSSSGWSRADGQVAPNEPTAAQLDYPLTAIRWISSTASFVLSIRV
jgi:hypothetical protein